MDATPDDGSLDSYIPTIDLSLSVVTESDAAFRFNSDDVYVPRDTAVFVRCELVDRVHGFVSPDNKTPCTLLVFDFQLDHTKRSRTIHEAVISLILDPKVKVVKDGLAPNKKIWLDAQLQNVAETNEIHLTGGATFGGSLDVGGSHGNTKSMDVLKYATVNGWTAYWPKPLYNNPKPHNCVKWSLFENSAKKDGVPTHFRAAVLLERQDDTPFQLQMEIDSKADLKTEVEDFSLLHGRAPKGWLSIDPTDPSTNRVKKFTGFNLKEELKGIFQVSLGALQKEAFSAG